MRLGQPLELLGPVWRELDPHNALVRGVRRAADKSLTRRAVYQLDRAVVTEHEVVREVTDRRAGGIGVSANGQQQLMLSWRQSRGPCLSLAPTEKAAQPGPELEQMLEVTLVEQHIAIRYRMPSIATEIGPTAGGAVMATGIISVGLHLDHAEALSKALLVLAVVSWIALGTLFLARLMLDRSRWRHDARQATAVTAVAATAVLGTRLTLLGWSWAGWALLALATAMWLALGPMVTVQRPVRVPTFCWWSRPNRLPCSLHRWQTRPAGCGPR